MSRHAKRRRLPALAVPAALVAVGAAVGIALIPVAVHLYLIYSAAVVIAWAGAIGVIAVLLAAGACGIAARRADPFGRQDDGGAAEYLASLKRGGEAEETLTHDLGKLGHLLRPRPLSLNRAEALAKKVARRTLLARGREQAVRAIAPRPARTVIMPLPAPPPMTEEPPAAITDITAPDPLYKPWNWPRTEDIPVITEPIPEGGAA